jgi:hypothetical protein
MTYSGTVILWRLIPGRDVISILFASEILSPETTDTYVPYTVKSNVFIMFLN